MSNKLVKKISFTISFNLSTLQDNLLNLLFKVFLKLKGRNIKKMGIKYKCNKNLSGVH